MRCLYLSALGGVGGRGGCSASYYCGGLDLIPSVSGVVLVSILSEKPGEPIKASLFVFESVSFGVFQWAERRAVPELSSEIQVMPEVAVPSAGEPSGRLGEQ